MKYTMNIIDTIADITAKFPIEGTMKPAKRKRLDRLVKCLEKATPLKEKKVGSVQPDAVDEEVEYTNYTLLSIDAWRNECGGWDWNNVSKIEEGIMIADDSDVLKNSRNLLAWMRKSDWLNDASKGKVKVDFGNGCNDIIEIQNKNTGEPILALSCVHG